MKKILIFLLLILAFCIINVLSVSAHKQELTNEEMATIFGGCGTTPLCCIYESGGWNCNEFPEGCERECKEASDCPT